MGPCSYPEPGFSSNLEKICVFFFQAPESATTFGLWIASSSLSNLAGLAERAGAAHAGAFQLMRRNRPC